MKQTEQTAHGTGRAKNILCKVKNRTKITDKNLSILDIHHDLWKPYLGFILNENRIWVSFYACFRRVDFFDHAGLLFFITKIIVQYLATRKIKYGFHLSRASKKNHYGYQVQFTQWTHHIFHLLEFLHTTIICLSLMQPSTWNANKISSAESLSIGPILLLIGYCQQK